MALTSKICAPGRRITPCFVFAMAMMLMFATSPAAAQRNAPARSRQITAAAAQAVKNEKIPGLVAAVADDKGLLGIGAAGVRKWGSDTKLTSQDLVHLGSCTKAMTCVMLATLVEEKKLRWDSTLVQVMPELREKIHRDYHNVTLWQLVTHRSRLPANAANWWVHRDEEIRQRRLKILVENLRNAPEAKAGGFLYSNLGYMVAGCMAEHVTGKSWEQLMQQRLFTPLGMKTAGFGPPGQRSQVDQPLGHVKADGAWTSRYFDNAAALGPAGTVHCSMADWAKFAALQLPGKPKILNRRALDFLITPQTGDYAAGWRVARRSWGKGAVLTHTGSNTMWFAVIWVAPKTNRIYMAATNSSDAASFKIVDAAIAGMIRGQ